MKAVVYSQYGKPDVLQLKEVEKPTPKDSEILVKIQATAVNSADWRLRKADPYAVRLFFGLMKPKLNILGGVFSGEVEAIGKNVTLFKTGDQIFGSTGMSFGAYAEYKCLPETGIFALKPTNISHQEAAVIPFGGITALYFIKKANIQPEQKVLIIGASGAIGSAAVQLAKYYGANVTGICSTANVEMVKSLGADAVIDYTQEDFSKKGEKYAVIFDTIGKISVAKCIQCLEKKGTLILGASMLSQMFQGLWASMTGTQKIISGVISEKAEDMIFLKELIASNKLKAVIDRTYSLAQMAEAHAYVEKGHKKGNVVITIA